MVESSIVAVVFRDLADAYTELSSGSTSPKAVRRSFATFVDLSQKLTSHMRTEYTEKKREKWIASDFDGWNDVTDLFKQLRNDDQHDHPIAILVNETQYFRTYEGGPDVAIDFTWSFSLEDQLLDNPRDDLLLEPVDSQTGRRSGQRVAPRRKEYEFHLYPSSKKAEDLLNKIGDRNVRTLSEKCFEILTAYYRYYERSFMKSNGRASQEP